MKFSIQRLRLKLHLDDLNIHYVQKDWRSLNDLTLEILWKNERFSKPRSEKNTHNYEKAYFMLLRTKSKN